MRTSQAWTARIYLTAILTIAIGAIHATSQEHQNTPREQWQRVPDIFRELGVAPGQHIADVGAGNGFFTTRLSNAVGSSGRVYAVDVNPVSLRELRETLGADVTNVTMIRGEENDPRLPEGQLDAVLIVNAYHEFSEYGAMLERIRGALKAGGRLVLVEPAPARFEDPRAAQTRRHTLAIELAEADLRAAGFEMVTQDARFAVRPDHRSAAEVAKGAPPTVEWLLVARRPGGTRLF